MFQTFPAPNEKEGQEKGSTGWALQYSVLSVQAEDCLQARDCLAVCKTPVQLAAQPPPFASAQSAASEHPKV